MESHWDYGKFIDLAFIKPSKPPTSPSIPPTIVMYIPKPGPTLNELPAILNDEVYELAWARAITAMSIASMPISPPTSNIIFFLRAQKTRHRMPIIIAMSPCQVLRPLILAERDIPKKVLYVAVTQGIIAPTRARIPPTRPRAGPGTHPTVGGGGGAIIIGIPGGGIMPGCIIIIGPGGGAPYCGGGWAWYWGGCWYWG